MQLNKRFLLRYLELAPSALAIERSAECQLLSEEGFERPVLDIGCGDGIFATVLTTEKIDVGIDINTREIEHAKKLNAYNELIGCSGSAIPKADGSFRTIFSNSVLEHIEDLPPVLREANRVLAADGRFFVTVPSDRFQQYSAVARSLRSIGLKKLAGRFEKFYNSFWRHHHCYDIAGWSNLFEDAGFEILKVEEYNPRNACTLNDLLVFPAGPALVAKKAINRWFVLPGVRRLSARLLYPLFRGLDEPRDVEKGGLLFFVLSKPAGANRNVA